VASFRWVRVNPLGSKQRVGKENLMSAEENKAIARRFAQMFKTPATWTKPMSCSHLS
jgi:hypothetical protein